MVSPAPAPRAPAAAFDKEAAVYDDGFGRNPVGLVFRYVFQERAKELFPSGARVLDLGCGTGEDALHLASLGVRIHAVDVSRRMIERAQAKADALGLGRDRVRFEVRAAEEVGGVEAGFDGAYSNFGALNCADLALVGKGLASVLRSGAPVLLSFMGRWPLPMMVRRALTGAGEERGEREPVVRGVRVPVQYLQVAEVRRLLGPSFHWARGFALGVLLPPPEAASWVEQHPQTFGLLAAVEALVRRWPGLRMLGDHVVLEGVCR